MLICHSCSVEDEEEDVLNRNYSIVTEQVDDDSDYNIENVVLTEDIFLFDTETQEETVRTISKNIKVYKNPDAMPVFEGCASIADNDERKDCSTNNLLKFIYTNLKYPQEARDQGIQGMVVVQFIIDKDGKVKNPKMVRETGGGTSEAVLEVIKFMNLETTWTPGRVNGKDVAVQYTMPVKFKLEG